MTTVKHTIIRASAGSGKTRALVRRMVRLLALGVKPESMVALTFTRKAAGEFFSRLLQQLAALAESPRAGAKYLDELAEDTREKCLRLLRLLLGGMDRLRLGTLDSFFAAMVQCVPFELGLTGAGAIMSDQERSVAREEALDAVLVDLMRPENDAARRELVEAWKQATFGNEGSSPAADIDSWVKHLHEWQLECPEAARWGNAKTIWPDVSSAVWAAEEDLTAAKAKLELALAMDAFGEKAARRWREFFDDIANHRSGTPLSDAVKYMLDPDRGEISLLKQGRGEWKMFTRNSVSLGPGASLALHHALRIVVGRELRKCCERTKGRRGLVEIFERHYRLLVRGAGRLVFDDLPLLLSGKLHPAGENLRERWAQLRQDMEYRLNARYDHWLFDEFQDTSARQWRVFQNLVDEVIQDEEGRRTFFAVGDLKQSIYLWREAEPELFLGVERNYASRFEPESLRVSWRSCPQVLEMVNDVFGNAEVLRGALPDAMEWWAFEKHEASEDTRDVRGHAALLQVEQKEHKDAALVALLRRINPVPRGLSCAVLVRSNDEAKRLASLLRRELPCEVLCESAEPVAVDNPVTLVLLSAMQLAAHPQDSFAWQHLRLSPLGAWIALRGATCEMLSAQTRREILCGGFFAAVETWIARLREIRPGLDAFSEWRLGQFLEMCAEYDAGGGRSVDAFLRFARETTVAAGGAARALNVMTVHKSKGLEFDVVILPDLVITSLDNDSRSDVLLWQREPDGEVAWLLNRPPRVVVEWDGRLTGEIERLKARGGFEGLCRLYVAMTRAKRGLYVLIDSKGNARSEAKIVREALGETGAPRECPIPGMPALISLYERGARDWFERHEILPAPATPPAASVDAKTIMLGAKLRKLGQPPRRRAPSGEESFRIRGAALLSPQRESSRGFGTLVHRLFAEIEWIEDLDDITLETKWRHAGLAAVEGYERAKEMVRQTLARDEVRPWFTNIGGTRQVWRERSFDLMADRAWISGQIDRVILERDGTGRITAATVLDFKTDQLSGDAEADMRAKLEGYAPQVALYRTAVSRLTGLPSSSIRAALIFTTQKEWRWMVDAKA